MSLEKYLDKIDACQLINFSAFRKYLPENIRSEVHSHFKVLAETPSLCFVSPTSPDIMADLRRLSGKPVNRIHASMKGDSHGCGTDCAFLLVFNDSGDPDRPDLVMIDSEGANLGFTPKPNVLLVENEQNFAHYRSMLKLMSSWTGADHAIGSVDVILSAGNRINKRITLDWIEQTYTNIFCAFDYDLGGLKAFKTLKSVILGAVFLAPSDWSQYSHCFLKTPVTNDRLIKAMDLAKLHNIPALAEAFSTHRMFMEQETLLSGVEEE